MKANALFSAAALCTVALAEVAVYGQCGGSGFQGETACASGSVCKEWNTYYHQCVPGTGDVAPAPAPSEEAPAPEPTVTDVAEPAEPTEAPGNGEDCSGGEEEEEEEEEEEQPPVESPPQETPVEEEPETPEPEVPEQTPAPVSSSPAETSAPEPTAQPPSGSPTTPGEVTSVLPQAAGTVETNEPIYVTGEFDGKMQRYDRDSAICKGQSEGGEKDTIFVLEDGATLSNVIIGPNQGEGVYCLGQCTINNVWWEDVCEDAISFKGNAATSYINGGGAFHASDKIIQFNTQGTIHVSNFYAEDYGKVARSCGTCEGGAGGRHFIMENVHAVNGGELCGVNSNYGDTCVITGNSCQAEGKSCTIWEGNPDGGEPKKLSSKPDGETCTADSLRATC